MTKHSMQTALAAGGDDLLAGNLLLEEGLDCLDYGLSIFDSNLRLVKYNSCLHEILDLPTEMVRYGARLEDFFRYNAERGDYGPGNVESIVRDRLNVACKGLPHCFRRRLPNGRTIEVKGRPLPSGGFLSTYTDVSKETSSNELKEMLGKIVERSLNEIYVFDADSFQFIEVNRGARKNLGYTMRELRRMSPLDILPCLTAEQLEESLQTLRLGKEEEVILETVQERSDQSRYEVEIHLQLMNVDGQPVFVAILQDITQRKETEKMMVASRDTALAASRTKSEFLANMSHELRTPLNAILGFSEAMKDSILGPHSNPAYEDYANSIHQSGTMLLGIINDILDVSKIEAGSLELEEDLTDLEKAIEASLSMVAGRAKERNLTIHTDFSNDLPPLMGDERRLKQILLNLLSNAVKFTEPGGEIFVSAMQLPSSDISIKIRDTGIGIAPTRQAEIFAPFARVENSMAREFEGVGLGLSIVKALVEQHGGTICVDSKSGEGTCFTFTLPGDRIRLLE